MLRCCNSPCTRLSGLSTFRCKGIAGFDLLTAKSHARRRTARLARGALRAVTAAVQTGAEGFSAPTRPTVRTENLGFLRSQQLTTSRYGLARRFLRSGAHVSITFLDNVCRAQTSCGAHVRTSFLVNICRAQKARFDAGGTDKLPVWTDRTYCSAGGALPSGIVSNVVDNNKPRGLQPSLCNPGLIFINHPEVCGQVELPTYCLNHAMVRCGSPLRMPLRADDSNLAISDLPRFDMFVN